jgi:thioredoxin 1
MRPYGRPKLERRGKNYVPVIPPTLEVFAKMAGSHTLEFSDQNFEQDVLNSPQPVLVDFWATWCAPCRMMSPTLDAVAVEYAGRVKVGKLNVDENLMVTSQYAIRSIPTLLLFKAGQIQEQLVGAASKEVINRLIDKYL